MKIVISNFLTISTRCSVHCLSVVFLLFSFATFYTFSAYLFLSSLPLSVSCSLSLTFSILISVSLLLRPPTLLFYCISNSSSRYYTFIALLLEGGQPTILPFNAIYLSNMNSVLALQIFNQRDEITHTAIYGQAHRSTIISNGSIPEMMMHISTYRWF